MRLAFRVLRRLERPAQRSESRERNSDSAVGASRPVAAAWHGRARQQCRCCLSAKGQSILVEVETSVAAHARVLVNGARRTTSVAVNRPDRQRHVWRQACPGLVGSESRGGDGVRLALESVCCVGDCVESELVGRGERRRATRARGGGHPVRRAEAAPGRSRVGCGRSRAETDPGVDRKRGLEVLGWPSCATASSRRGRVAGRSSRGNRPR